MATDQQQRTVTVRQFEGVTAAEADEAPVTIPPVARKSLNDMGALPRTLIPLAVVAASVLVFSQLVALWPAVLNATPDISRAGAGANAVITTPEAMESSMLFGIWTPSFQPEVAVLLMVVMTGLPGALIGTGRREERRRAVVTTAPRRSAPRSGRRPSRPSGRPRPAPRSRRRRGRR